MKKIAVIQSQAMVSIKHPERGITAGGTQRYTLQLAKLLKQEGYEIYILARAEVKCSDMEMDYGRLIIFNAPMNKIGDYVYSKYIFNFCHEKKANLVCYVDLQVAKYFCYPKSFALQHGIGWDEPLRFYQRIKRYFITKDYAKITRKFQYVICVDTNFINWMRCHDKYFFKNRGKYIYIPNFADDGLFPYFHKVWGKNEEKILLYPRRLVEYRGYSLFIQMCEELKRRGYNISPILAFEENAADDYDEIFQGKLCKYRIVHPNLGEISREYQNAYLTFVPTLWSEGTSLSAIEAIATGCPVITSDVGGLGNIVIPGLVGDIVSPTVDAFVEATEKVLKDSSIRDIWSKNCEVVRQSFLTSAWNEKMLKIIRNYASQVED